MKSALRLLLLLFLVLATPLRGFAMTEMDMCALDHHGHEAGAAASDPDGHAHVHGHHAASQATAAHDSQAADDSRSWPHGASNCSACSACCAGACAGPSVPPGVGTDAHADAFLFRAPAFYVFIPENAERPPLTSSL